MQYVLVAQAASNVPELVTRISSFGVRDFVFIGTWNNQTYQAHIWLRRICQEENKQLVKVVAAFNQAPDVVFDNHRVHTITPTFMLFNHRLPALSFELTREKRPTRVDAKMEYWDEYVEAEWLAGVINGQAVLANDIAYTLRLEGSDMVYQLLPEACSHVHPLFKKGGVWIGQVEVFMKRQAGDPLRYLLMEHMRYHKMLQFQGTLLVVNPATAQQLLEDKEVEEAVRKQGLVLLTWEYPLQQGSSFANQIPGNNLLKLIMAGSEAMLALWDPDEFLVIPGHQDINKLVRDGCLSHLKDLSTPEAILPISWTYPAASKQPDIQLWAKYKNAEEAMQKLDYRVRHAKSCNWGIYCKSIINPNTQHNMHVHQLVLPPPTPQSRESVGRECAYLHHFFRMWHVKPIWDQTTAAAEQKLKMEDLPFEQQQRRRQHRRHLR